MKVANRSALSMVSVMLAVGCVQETAPTVEYFRAHEDERKSQLHHCSNEAAGAQTDPFCINAREAERLESIGQLRDLPPVGLPPVQSGAPAEKHYDQQED